MNIYNNDCFNIFPKIKNKTIDLFLLDLPYGQTAMEWDVMIDLDKMWVEIKRMMKPDAIIIFFTTTKFGYTLINSNPKWFRYDLVWEKSNSVGWLNAKKMPLKKHELIYIFDHKEHDIEIVKNTKLREYSKKCFEYMGKTKKELLKEIGQGIDHFLRFNSSQFSLPIKKNYEKLNIENMEDYLTYEKMKEMEEVSKKKYNPQMTKGKPYKTNGGSDVNNIYGCIKKVATDNKGERCPTSILKFSSPTKSNHSTQKPIDLLEWLIKSYSNEGDLVMDFTMGSGSAGIACKNTNRNFIGIEKDKKIFNTAKKLLNV